MDQPCEVRVSSAHSFRGRRCLNRAIVERDGHYYCKTHDPVLVEARRAKRYAEQDAKREAERQARDRQLARSQKLIQRLGVGVPSVNMYGSTFTYTGGVTLTATEAETLAAKLTRLEDLEFASRMAQ